MPLTTLAITVKSVRKELGLTQQELADLAGTSMLFISQLERGKQSVRMDKVLPVLAILGIEVCLQRGTESVVVEEL